MTNPTTPQLPTPALDAAACTHVRVVHSPEQSTVDTGPARDLGNGARAPGGVQTLTRDRWRCVACNTEFQPVPLAEAQRRSGDQLLASARGELASVMGLVRTSVNGPPALGHAIDRADRLLMSLADLLDR